MAKRKGGITAAELLEQLNSDLEYLARMAVKEAEYSALERACKDDEKDIVAELKKLGLAVESVWDLVNNAPHQFLERGFLEGYEVAYPLLVEHLMEPHHPRIREGVIRALTEKAARDSASDSLIQALQSETEQSHRWCIANALETMLSKPEVEAHPEIGRALEDGYL